MRIYHPPFIREAVRPEVFLIDSVILIIIIIDRRPSDKLRVAGRCDRRIRDVAGFITMPHPKYMLLGKTGNPASPDKVKNTP